MEEIQLNISRETNRSKNSSRNKKIEGSSDYKEKYLKLNSQYESDKNLLIKLRKTTNKLKTSLERLNKKEVLYNELYEKNNNLIQENEGLYNKLVESEEIRNEQEKLIQELQKEVMKLRQQNFNI